MRKIIILEHISIDGVIQSPGGMDEDTENSFKKGGWIEGYSDQVLAHALTRKLNTNFDLLLGRKTFDIWASYWPDHNEVWPSVNTATKYVVSNTLTSTHWHPTKIIKSDIAEEIKKLKLEEGPNIHVWGSSILVQTLLKESLIDTIWLMIYPITLGDGKRLFGSGSIPNKFMVKESQTTTKGVIITEYEKVTDK